MAQRSASERRPIPEADIAAPALPPERLPARSLTEVAVETVRERILDLTLRPGLRIDEKSVVYRHAFKNALVPVVTVLGLQVALLMSGAVLTETTFNWPGIGFELVRYLNNRDYIAVQGIITVFALAVVLVSLMIDLANAFIDPRVRY